MDNECKKTYGILFFEYIDSKMILYLKHNTKDFYEDFNLCSIELIESLSNINTMYKAFNAQKNHVTFLLNKKTHNDLFEKIKTNSIISLISLISLNTFNSKPFHKTLHLLTFKMPINFYIF